MEDIKNTILAHCNHHPLMAPQDAVKLLYQSTFGGDHLLGGRAADESLERLLEEWESLAPDTDTPLLEHLGGGMVRLGLCQAKGRGYTPQGINRIFLAGARQTHGCQEELEQNLVQLESLSESGVLPFPAQTLREYLRTYRAEGYPMLSHSAIFRENYRPSYRVIPAGFVACLPICEAIHRLLECKGRAIVSIDGLCGSGKTTLAALLTQCYDGEMEVVHMDDFFLPPALRTPERLKEPGGNVHYERFLTEVVPGLAAGRAFSHRIYDCSVMDYRGTREFQGTTITLVEGSYSQHPLIDGLYDLKVFTTCTRDVQGRRLLSRGGPALYERFVREWIPMENRYFETFAVQEGCQMVLDTGEQPLLS